MKLLLTLFAVFPFMCGCDQSGKEYKFVVPKGYEGDLIISERSGGIDTSGVNELLFDSSGSVFVKDINFFSKWNKIHFVFDDGSEIHNESVDVKSTGSYYVTRGKMDQNQVMKYTVWKEEAKKGK